MAQWDTQTGKILGTDCSPHVFFLRSPPTSHHDVMPVGLVQLIGPLRLMILGRYCMLRTPLPVALDTPPLYPDPKTQYGRPACLIYSATSHWKRQKHRCVLLYSYPCSPSASRSLKNTTPSLKRLLYQSVAVIYLLMLRIGLITGTGTL
jgi:hypothetical protein